MPSDDDALPKVSDPEVLARIVDSDLLTSFDRWNTELVRPIEHKSPLRDIPLHIDPEQWALSQISEPDQFVRPDGLDDLLKEVTPQALLRDLHRPPMNTERPPLELRIDNVFDPGARNATAEAKAAQELEPLPYIEKTSALLREDMVRRRVFLQEKWQPYLSDDTPRPTREEEADSESPFAREREDYDDE